MREADGLNAQTSLDGLLRQDTHHTLVLDRSRDAQVFWLQQHQHGQQRGFAGAVATNETNLFPIANGERHRL
jgi:hypothetical protein